MIIPENKVPQLFNSTLRVIYATKINSGSIAAEIPT